MGEIKERKWLFIVLIIVLVLSCGGLVYNLQSNKEKKEKSFFDFFDMFRSDEMSNMSKDTFNFTFSYASGHNEKIFALSIVDNIIMSNNKNKDKLIELVYDGEHTTDVDKIKNIKMKMSNSIAKSFDVTLAYDNEGFINKITIEANDVTVNNFNSQFTLYDAGTLWGSLIVRVLDIAIESNRKYENHQVYVVYNGNNTNAADKIRNIKKHFKTFDDYELIYEYDPSGYINKVRIEG